MATKTLKRKVNLKEVNVKNGIKLVKSSVAKVNDVALDVTEDLLDGTIERGAKWQKIADKTLKGGLKLAANQQDIMFDTLDIIKGQLADNRKRFAKLFSMN